MKKIIEKIADRLFNLMFAQRIEEMHRGERERWQGEFRSMKSELLNRKPEVEVNARDIEDLDDVVYDCIGDYDYDEIVDDRVDTYISNMDDPCEELKERTSELILAIKRGVETLVKEIDQV